MTASHSFSLRHVDRKSVTVVQLDERMLTESNTLLKACEACVTSPRVMRVGPSAKSRGAAMAYGRMITDCSNVDNQTLNSAVCR